MSGGGPSRVVSIVVSVLAAIAVGGLIVTAVLGITGEKYGNYGEVPIPGSGIVRLPAGEVIVSFRVADHRGGGLRVPPLTLDITPPDSGTPQGLLWVFNTAHMEEAGLYELPGLAGPPSLPGEPGPLAVTAPQQTTLRLDCH